MNDIDCMDMEFQTVGCYISNYINHIEELLNKLDKCQIETYVEELIQCYNKDKSIFIIGNGGSATTSSHIANDISIGITKKIKSSKRFRAVSLTDNVAVITAIANDFSYEDIFVKQLKAQYQEGDVLLAISCSGNSQNIIKAVEWVRSKGGKIICFVGFDGGKLKELSDIVIHIESWKDDYGPVEDIQLILNHLSVSWLQNSLVNNLE